MSNWYVKRAIPAKAIVWLPGVAHEGVEKQSEGRFVLKTKSGLDELRPGSYILTNAKGEHVQLDAARFENEYQICDAPRVCGRDPIEKRPVHQAHGVVLIPAELFGLPDAIDRATKVFGEESYTLDADGVRVERNGHEVYRIDNPELLLHAVAMYNHYKRNVESDVIRGFEKSAEGRSVVEIRKKNLEGLQAMSPEERGVISPAALLKGDLDYVEPPIQPMLSPNKPEDVQ